MITHAFKDEWITANPTASGSASMCTCPTGTARSPALYAVAPCRNDGGVAARAPPPGQARHWFPAPFATVVGDAPRGDRREATGRFADEHLCGACYRAFTPEDQERAFEHEQPALTSE